MTNYNLEDEDVRFEFNYLRKFGLIPDPIAVDCHSRPQEAKDALMRIVDDTGKSLWEGTYTEYANTENFIRYRVGDGKYWPLYDENYEYDMIYCYLTYGDVIFENQGGGEDPYTYEDGFTDPF